MSDVTYITKADGSREPFKREKLVASLERAGADAAVIDTIVAHITASLRDGMTTHEIYQRAFDRLKAHTRTVAARYSLRHALLALGPSGYPFEAFIGKLFAHDEYATTLRVHVAGACVTHEIDVCACKENTCIGIEAKFHNAIGIKSDLQDALYVAARFNDIVAGSAQTEHGAITEGLLVTNTKFSSQAIAYSECAGLALLGWGYAYKGKTLEERIESAGLHPITCLPSLSKETQQALLQSDMVLARDARDPHVLKDAGVPEDEIGAVQQDISELCT